MGSGGWMWGMHSWVLAFAVAGTLVLWAVVVTVIDRMLRPRDPPRGPDAESLSGLDERLAAGDIDVDEYRTRRRRLVDGH